MTTRKDQKQIVVGCPSISTANGLTRITSIVTYNGETLSVWAEVDDKYGKYLCVERSDAYVVGLLNFAMRNKCDIVCKAPMSQRLKYQLETFLIPSLIRHDNTLYATQIVADEDGYELPCAGAVGTGCSCGVDSFHVIKRYGKEKFHGIQLTHLMLLKIGGIAYDETRWRLKVAHTKTFCLEYGYELITFNTNFSLAFPQDHLLTDGYANSFGILTLQKLWKIYFYGSSGLDLSGFDLTDNSKRSDAHYDLLLFDCLSTERLKIYLDGLDIPRFDKLRYILDFEPIRKYLDVCLENTGRNCGRCRKCKRTLVMLDALGALDKAFVAFDAQKYRQKRHQYLRWLYRQRVVQGGDPSVSYAYEILKKEIGIRARLPVWMDALRCLLGRRPDGVAF